MRWAVVLTSLSLVEYDNHFSFEDSPQGPRPQFFACHPSVHEPHVGTGTAEEVAMGYGAKQPTDLRDLHLVGDLDGGYTNVAQLSLSLMGFCRDFGPNLAAQRTELLAIAGAVPESLLSSDAATVIRGWAKVSPPSPSRAPSARPPQLLSRPACRRATTSACTPRPRP